MSGQAQAECAGGVERGVEEHPDLSGKDLHLQDGGNGEIVQREDERQHGGLDEPATRDWQQEAANKSEAGDGGIAFELRRFEPLP